MATTSIRTRYLAAAISTALAAGGLHAATITVDSADDDVASEYCNLRYALQAINGGSTANVPTCSSAVSGSAFALGSGFLGGMPLPTTSEGCFGGGAFAGGWGDAQREPFERVGAG